MRRESGIVLRWTSSPHSHHRCWRGDSGASAVITRTDAKVYSQKSAQKAAQLQTAPRVAVTFRMNKSEFVRLRRGADKIGAQPRDIVKRAISNCLDAYGVAPAPDKTGV